MEKNIKIISLFLLIVMNVYAQTDEITTYEQARYDLANKTIVKMSEQLTSSEKVNFLSPLTAAFENAYNIFDRTIVLEEFIDYFCNISAFFETETFSMSNSLDLSLDYEDYVLQSWHALGRWYVKEREKLEKTKTQLDVQREKERKTQFFEGNHEYVDLALSVKWATCNVGAEQPEDYGNYFAWGEVESKWYYDWSTYKYSKGRDLIKYCVHGESGKDGFIDNKTILDIGDDAAAVIWGGKWRMPTDGEWGELEQKCRWIRISQNGVDGYKIIGPNGNSIFLPAAGYMSDANIYGIGEKSIYYWSSRLDTSSFYRSYRAYRSEADYGTDGNAVRCNGLPVRAVCP